MCWRATLLPQASSVGHVLHVDGHVALLLLRLGMGSCDVLRPNYLLLFPRVQARANAASGIAGFFHYLHVPVSPPDIVLPQALFGESSDLFL